MKKVILIILSVGLFVLTILTITTNLGKAGTEVLQHDEYDVYIQSIGLDVDLFSNVQKEIIYTCNLEYKAELAETTYVVPSANTFEFSRHWGIDRTIDYDQESDLDITAYYFESEECNKVILLSFSVPYHVSRYQSSQFIHFSYSLNYIANIQGSMTYEDNGKEYLLESYNASQFISGDNALPYTIDLPGVSLSTNELYYLNQIGIPYNKENLGYFNFPEIKYSYMIQLDNSEDNQTNESDDYVGLDIDFYTASKNADFSVKLGFNEFKQSNGSYDIYVVKRISLSFEREAS